MITTRENRKMEVLKWILCVGAICLPIAYGGDKGIDHLIPAEGVFSAREAALDTVLEARQRLLPWNPRSGELLSYLVIPEDAGPYSLSLIVKRGSYTLVARRIVDPVGEIGEPGETGDDVSDKVNERRGRTELIERQMAIPEELALRLHELWKVMLLKARYSPEEMLIGEHDLYPIIYFKCITGSPPILHARLPRKTARRADGEVSRFARIAAHTEAMVSREGKARRQMLKELENLLDAHRNEIASGEHRASSVERQLEILGSDN